MLVHLHLPDHLFDADTASRECDTPLPVGVVSFRHRWHVGQV